MNKSGDPLPSPALPQEHCRFFALTGFRVAGLLTYPQRAGYRHSSHRALLSMTLVWSPLKVSPKKL